MSLNVEANKYTVDFHDAQMNDDQLIPDAVTVSYSRGALDTMIGLSPLDGKMVIHVDTNAEPLRAIYVNDHLVYGEDAPRPEPDKGEEWIRPFADSLTDTERLVK